MPQNIEMVMHTHSNEPDLFNQLCSVHEVIKLNLKTILAVIQGHRQHFYFGGAKKWKGGANIVVVY